MNSPGRIDLLMIEKEDFILDEPEYNEIRNI